MTQSTEQTFMIVRQFMEDSDTRHGEIIRVGLTLENAKAHCASNRGSEIDQNNNIIWFDAYIEE